MDASKMTDGELINLIFNHPFVPNQTKAELMIEYRKRLRENIEKDDKEE